VDDMTNLDQGDDSAQRLSQATLAGGCFWCIEAVFELLNGVESVKSGYAGGHVVDPTYEQICTGMTGHAEVLQIMYDQEIISFTELLETFFAVHDPTTLNRQGHDVGTQYRSSIFCHNAEQQDISRQAIEFLSNQGIWVDPIVTEVVPLEIFYPAEQYHQQYYRNNPESPYCQYVISPKLSKFREHYLGELRIS
jgi:peptide-methionine (S)-S-oxide reductase